MAGLAARRRARECVTGLWSAAAVAATKIIDAAVRIGIFVGERASISKKMRLLSGE